MPRECSDENEPHPTVELLRRSKDGDRRALEELAARFRPSVERLVRARMGPALLRKEGLEDLVQETFLQLLQSWEEFEPRPDAHFVAYLAKIVHRTVASRVAYYGAQKRSAREIPLETQRGAGDDSADAAREPAARGGSAAGLAASKEMEELVDSCVAELGESYREVILLRDYAGADWAFVAAELGSPSVSAAQQLHRRARMKLAERVGRLL